MPNRRSAVGRTLAGRARLSPAVSIESQPPGASQPPAPIRSSAAWASPEDSLRSLVIAMTRRPLGAACVVDRGGVLAGLITDGDLRRALQAYDDIRPLHAADIMTARPTTIGPDAKLHEALRLMEDRPSQISVLPVVDPVTRRCLGLLRLHDIYQARFGA